MSKNIVQFFTVNLVFFLGIFFLLIYIFVAKNILDVFYLIFLVIYYFSVKYYGWQKYH